LLGHSLSLVQRSVPITAEAGGSSPPRPTIIKSPILERGLIG
jgi:hypothetical protein